MRKSGDSGQAPTIHDLQTIGAIPGSPIDRLNLCAADRAALRNIVSTQTKLRELGVGMTLVISAPDLDAGLDTALALARECGLLMNRLALHEAMFAEKPSVWDTEGRETRVLREAFHAVPNSAGRITVFVDYRGHLGKMLVDHREAPFPEIATFLSWLRTNFGLACIVATGIRDERELPPEFHALIRIAVPSVIDRVKIPPCRR